MARKRKRSGNPSAAAKKAFAGIERAKKELELNIKKLRAALAHPGDAGAVEGHPHGARAAKGHPHGASGRARGHPHRAGGRPKGHPHGAS